MSSPNAEQNRPKRQDESPDVVQRFMVIGAIGFCIVSALGIVYAAYIMVNVGNNRSLPSEHDSLLRVLGQNFDLVSVFLFTLLAAWIGLSLFAKASSSTAYVVRREDADYIWPLIADEKVVAIDQYIRLASLSGLSGSFQKIGFTGLPLATVSLTIFFVIASLLTGDHDLMELGKLTLGAFIGSFVQRQVERADKVPPGGSDTSRSPEPKLPA